MGKRPAMSPLKRPSTAETRIIKRPSAASEKEPSSIAAYCVLGLAPKATPEQIRAAYKRKALEAHPDKGGSAARFRQVLKAFETLSETTSAPPRRGQVPGQRSSRLMDTGLFLQMLLDLP